MYYGKGFIHSDVYDMPIYLRNFYYKQLSDTRKKENDEGSASLEFAKKYGVTVRAIQDVNPSLDSRRLQIGQIVKIPTIAAASSTAGQAAAPLAADEYVIQRGDSLSVIAQRHGTTVKALRAANNLKTDLILAGEKLKLPPGSRFNAPASSTGTGSFLPPPPGTE